MARPSVHGDTVPDTDVEVSTALCPVNQMRPSLFTHIGKVVLLHRNQWRVDYSQHFSLPAAGEGDND